MRRLFRMVVRGNAADASEAATVVSDSPLVAGRPARPILSNPRYPLPSATRATFAALKIESREFGVSGWPRELFGARANTWL